MTREEHLQWAKKRALELLNSGDKNQAFISMLSDLGKHEELKNHSGGKLGTMLMLGGFMKTESEIRNWIEGFR